MAEPVVSKRVYLRTFVCLLGLTAMTTLLGFVDMGPFSTPVAVALAGAKAALIAGYFMHAFYESRTLRVAMAAGVMWLLILISLTVVDYISRPWHDVNNITSTHR